MFRRKISPPSSGCESKPSKNYKKQAPSCLLSLSLSLRLSPNYTELPMGRPLYDVWQEQFVVLRVRTSGLLTQVSLNVKLKFSAMWSFFLHWYID
jgi:hypothetical protein